VDQGAAFTGGAGNDTFLGFDTITPLEDGSGGYIYATTPHLSALDSLDGGGGINTLKVVGTGTYTVPTSVTVTNIQSATLGSGGGIDADVSKWTGLTTLGTTSTGKTTLTAAATTDVIAVNTGATSTLAISGGNAVSATVTGTAGAVTIDGSAGAVTVSQATEGAITIGNTTAVKGAVSVSSSAQGSAAIGINGGTSVSVASTTVGTGGVAGTVTVGAATAPTGAVSVTQTLKGTGALAGGAIAVTGGTTVSVTQIASQATNNTDTVLGAVTVTGKSTTTEVSVVGTAVVTKAATSAAVTESNAATFIALAKGASVTVGGLTFVAGKAGTTAAETAAAFASLADGATTGASTKGTYSGALSGWSTGTVSTATVTFTSATAATNVTDLSQVTTGQTTAGVTFVKVEGAAAAGKGGIVAGAVTINDAVTSNTSTTASTISKVTASDYTTVAVDSNALNTLSLTRGSGNVTIDNVSSLASPTKTLALSLNGVTAGTLADGGVYTTLNVTTSGAASTLTNVTAAGVTAMSLSGDKVLTLASAAGLAALKTVTISGSAGLSADLSALVTGGTIDASGTSGANTVTVKSTVATYSGGTGVDTVTTHTAGVSKTISLGDGDDSLTIGNGITTLTAAVSGGNGSDQLIMQSADADTADADAAFVANLSGFEKLTLSTGGGTVDVQKFGPGNDVTMTATASTTISNVPANPTVTIAGAQGGTLTITGADVTGASDVLNLVQTNAMGGVVAAAGYETVNLTSSVASGVINIANADLKTLNISGTKSTTVTLNAANVLATTIDASGNSGGVTITSVSTAAAKITGGSGNDVLTMKSGTTAETLIGNAGNDSLTSNAGLSIMTGGSGFDNFKVVVSANKNVYTTITDFSAGDSLELTNQGTETFNATALALAPTASFTDYLNLAAIGTSGATNGAISYFYFAGNTYVVEDLSNTASFVDGTDIVVALTGLVDLSNSTLQGASTNILLNGGV
jgi:S-layer protein